MILKKKKKKRMSYHSDNTSVENFKGIKIIEGAGQLTDFAFKFRA